MAAHIKNYHQSRFKTDLHIKQVVMSKIDIIFKNIYFLCTNGNLKATVLFQ